MDIEIRRLGRINTSWRMSGPDLLGWGLYLLALLQFLLLFTIQDIRSPNAFKIYWLYPIGIAGAAILTMYGASIQPNPKHRWAWMLQALSCLFGVTRSSLGLWFAERGETLPQLPSFLLYIGMYLGSLGAVALYLPRKGWWLGNAPRVLIDSATIGFAALLILSSIASVFVPSWTNNSAQILFFVGANVAMVFAVSTVSMRYRGGAGPLLNFALLSIICLMLGDTIPTIASLFPNVPRWGSVVNPLYILHYSLLAAGIYRSA